MAINHYSKVTATGAVSSNACVISGMLIGTDGSNDPVVTVYDNTTNTNEVIPTTTYDASVLGLNGVTLPKDGVKCQTGIYVEITCAGSVEVLIYYSTKHGLEGL